MSGKWFVKALSLTFISYFIVCLSSEVNASDITKDTVYEWAFKKMAVWSPPGKSYFPDAQEEEQDAIKRYKDIAVDVFSVAFDPEESPLFKGPNGRSKTAALLLSVANMESAFRKDVDFGIGSHAKGDGGQSWCLMQVQLGVAVNGKTKNRISLNKDSFTVNSDPASWGGEDLIADRKKCIRAGLHIMRSSFIMCASLPVEEKLAAYASGSCSSGKNASRVRVESAMKWLTASPPPAVDAKISELLYPSTKLEIAASIN